jgi:MSHA biogenesis protein MshE
VQFLRGRGCAYCNHTGYQGRIGIYEFLEMDEQLLAALHQGDLQAFGEAARRQAGYQTLKRSAIELATRGLTTMDQVMRATFGLED